MNYLVFPRHAFNPCLLKLLSAEEFLPKPSHVARIQTCFCEPPAAGKRWQTAQFEQFSQTSELQRATKDVDGWPKLVTDLAGSCFCDRRNWKLQAFRRISRIFICKLRRGQTANLEKRPPGTEVFGIGFATQIQDVNLYDALWDSKNKGFRVILLC